MNKVIIVAGLGYGDESKGSCVDWLARENPEAHTVVRYNGGAQAGHNVVTPDGKHHTFSQFGAGTFAGTDTFLSKYMLIDPIAMIPEAQHLELLGIKSPLSRLIIDENALMVSPYQRAANRVRQTLHSDFIVSSCGMGIGETVEDSIAYPKLRIIAKDLLDLDTLADKLEAIQKQKCSELYGSGIQDKAYREQVKYLIESRTQEFMAEYAEIAKSVHIVSSDYLNNIILPQGVTIFEGAQGVLLDEWYGFHPYTTWTDTTFRNAIELLSGFTNEVTKIGITRGYMTRHGSGPFITYNEGLTKALPDDHNIMNTWQGEFRVGYLDLVMLKYALAVIGKIDILAVTHLDRLSALPRLKVCNYYQHGIGDFNTLTIHHKNPGSIYNSGAQRKLTAALMTECNPSYASDLANIDNYLQYIGDTLGTGVGIVSRGPTFKDKEYYASPFID